MIKEAQLYQPLADSRVRCTACARYCNIPEGKIGFCGVRQNIGGKLHLLVYGKVITGHIDPIEKKPVTHYMPGSKIFSIATTGCSWLCSYCFAPETFVFTSKGVKTLAELYDESPSNSEEGLRANRKPIDLFCITHKGRYRRIKQVFRHFYDGPLLSIRPMYLPTLRCTPDHRILTTTATSGHAPVKVQARFITNKNFLVIPKFSERKHTNYIDLVLLLKRVELPEYKSIRSTGQWRLSLHVLERISELSTRGIPGRQIAKQLSLSPTTVWKALERLKQNTPSELSNPYKRYRVLTSDGRLRLSNSKQTVPRFLPLSEDLAKFLGYYCADGSISRSRNRPNSYSVSFTFAREEISNIEDVVGLVKKLFGLHCSLTSQGSVTHVSFSNSILGIMLRETCGKDCYTKKVPDFILSSGAPELAKGFLTGYLKGDGYTTPANSPEATYLGANTVSKELNFGVSLLFIKLGSVPRLYVSQNPSTAVIGGRTVNRHNDYMLKVLKRNSTSSRNVLEWEDIRGQVIERDDYYLVPVRSVDSEHYSGFVYNLEVEEDHTYTANLYAVSNCQNFDISQRRKVEGTDMMPPDVAALAVGHGCQGLAYTYNQPTIFMEFAHDVGVEARRNGLINIFVSNGYDTPDTVGMMNDFLDCITIDFKGNAETSFVRKYIGIANADPIFQTILEIRDKTKVHMEFTDLVIPEVGDKLEDARKLSRWLFDNLGPDYPIHFLRFHPDYKMMNLPHTPVKTLEEHCRVAREEGLRYVYVGNVPGHPLEHTYCPECKSVAIKRYGFDITSWNLDENNRCANCGYQLPIIGGLSSSVSDDRFLPVIN